MDRTTHITSEQDFPVEKVRELKKNIPFIKPPLFKREQEFRFVFSLEFRGKKIPIAGNPKFLQLRPIDSILIT